MWYDASGPSLWQIGYATSDSTLLTFEESEQLPSDFRVEQNYPNPFNPLTEVRIAIPSSGHLKVSIYDILGRELVVLRDSEHETGLYTIIWDGTTMSGKRVSSGTYICRAELTSESGEKTPQIIKMALVK